MGLGLSAKYFSSIVLLILENIFVDLHLGKIMNAGHLQGMDYFFFSTVVFRNELLEVLPPPVPGKLCMLETSDRCI